MIYDSVTSSLVILLGLSQLVFLIMQILAKKVNTKYYDWKSWLKNIIIYICVVGILYFTIVTILNVIVGDTTNSNLVMSYILLISVSLVLVIDIVFDPFEVNKLFLSKDNTIHPPKSIKEHEYVHPPKSINKTIEK